MYKYYLSQTYVYRAHFHVTYIFQGDQGEHLAFNPDMWDHFCMFVPWVQSYVCLVFYKEEIVHYMMIFLDTLYFVARRFSHWDLVDTSVSYPLLSIPDMWSSVFLLPLLLLPSTETVKSGFSVGRISEGQFEYSQLNGWMTPRRARSLCENNSQCGGFTYKVKQLSASNIV